jgi:hypothetical protein
MHFSTSHSGLFHSPVLVLSHLHFPPSFPVCTPSVLARPAGASQSSAGTPQPPPPVQGPSCRQSDQPQPPPQHNLKQRHGPRTTNDHGFANPLIVTVSCQEPPKKHQTNQQNKCRARKTGGEGRGSCGIFLPEAKGAAAAVLDADLANAVPGPVYLQVLVCRDIYSYLFIYSYLYLIRRILSQASITTDLQAWRR